MLSETPRRCTTPSLSSIAFSSSREEVCYDYGQGWKSDSIVDFLYGRINLKTPSGSIDGRGDPPSLVPAQSENTRKESPFQDHYHYRTTESSTKRIFNSRKKWRSSIKASPKGIVSLLPPGNSRPVPRRSEPGVKFSGKHQEAGSRTPWPSRY